MMFVNLQEAIHATALQRATARAHTWLLYLPSSFFLALMSHLQKPLLGISRFLCNHDPAADGSSCTDKVARRNTAFSKSCKLDNNRATKLTRLCDLPSFVQIRLHFARLRAFRGAHSGACGRLQIMSNSTLPVERERLERYRSWSEQVSIRLLPTAARMTPSRASCMPILSACGLGGSSGAACPPTSSSQDKPAPKHVLTLVSWRGS